MIKSLLLVVLGLAAVALGALYAREHAEAQRTAARVGALEAQLHRQRAELDKQTAVAETLTKEKTMLTGKVESTMKRLLKARAAVSAPAAASTDPVGPPPAEETPAGAVDAKPAADAKKPGAPFGDYVAKMMKDPAMKKMMRTTQGAALRQMYGDLVKQWALPPEEANTFYDVLLDRQMAMMDNVGKDPGELSASIKDADASLKASLGDEMYGQYKDYEKTLGNRMALNQFKQRLDADNVPALNPDQAKFLMDTMADAKKNQPPGGMFGADSMARIGKTGTFSEADVAEFVKTQTATNEKVATTAGSMLTPAQLASFKQYQASALDMQKMGFEMAAKMHGGGP